MTKISNKLHVTKDGIVKRNPFSSPVLKFNKAMAEKIMSKSADIENEYKYSSGGYYKNQAENHDLYLAVRREMTNLPKLDKKYFDYFENWNYHSLNAVLGDLAKFDKVEYNDTHFKEL